VTLAHRLSTSPARRRQRATGNAAEALLEAQHAIARARGLAYVTKRPTPVRVTRVDRGRVSGFFERSPGVDYCGLLAGGRAIYAEAKACHSGSFALREIEPEQVAELDLVASLGALAYLLVVWTPTTVTARSILGGQPVVCAIPWQVVREHITAGHPSLPGALLTRYATRGARTWLDTITEDRP
jgi:hypothetical protein